MSSRQYLSIQQQQQRNLCFDIETTVEHYLTIQKIEPFIGEKDLYVDFAECKNTVAVVVLCLKMKYGKGLNP